MALINPAVLLDPPCEPGCPRKRRRLDNLTPEQRALRRFVKLSQKFIVDRFWQQFVLCTCILIGPETGSKNESRML